MTGRIVRRVVVFLLLGAIINVAVAWGCCFASHAILSPYFYGSEVWSKDAKARAAWRYSMPQSCEPLAWREVGGQWFGYEGYALRGACTCDRTVLQVLNVDAGWPLMSLRGQKRQQVSRNDPIGWHYISVSAIDFTHSPLASLFVGKNDGFVWLPWGPLWPCFAINTIFYAAILWLLFAFPFTLRRWRRIKRVLCPACAYDLRGRTVDKNVCPECGTNASKP